MRYAEVTAALYMLAPRGMRLGLGGMRRACALRGHPERAVPSVHVAGTNGKGSVVTLLSALLSQAGYRVGAFTSPHLHSYTERFRIDGEPVSKRRLAAAGQSLLRWLERPGVPQLTFFEVSTLLAFELFREADCDLMVLEVGLGGRLDSTNVVTPELSVITHIGLDHTGRLGSTLAAIGREKAGIIKRGRPLVVGARSPSARRAIAEVAKVRQASVRWLGADFGSVEATDGTLSAWAGSSRIERLRPRLLGDYQRDHVATAYAAARWLAELGWQVPDTAVRRGVAAARWPGRLEWLAGRPRVLLDAAHNPDGARSLAGYLSAQRRPVGPVVLLFGAMADKQVRPMWHALRPLADRCVLTRPMGERSLDLQRWARAGDIVEPSPAVAFERAEQLAGSRGWVVVAGSIFLMAEVRARRLGIAAEPAIRL